MFFLVLVNSNHAIHMAIFMRSYYLTPYWLILPISFYLLLYFSFYVLFSLVIWILASHFVVLFASSMLSFWWDWPWLSGFYTEPPSLMHHSLLLLLPQVSEHYTFTFKKLFVHISVANFLIFKFLCRCWFLNQCINLYHHSSALEATLMTKAKVNLNAYLYLLILTYHLDT